MRKVPDSRELSKDSGFKPASRDEGGNVDPEQGLGATDGVGISGAGRGTDGRPPPARFALGARLSGATAWYVCRNAARVSSLDSLGRLRANCQNM